MSAETRQAGSQDHATAAHVRFNPLLNQILAACGYAFAIAGLAIELLGTHRGHLIIATGIALSAVPVPVNVYLIRRFARLRHFPATHHPSPFDPRSARHEYHRSNTYGRRR